jgi:hypothetical protein
MSADAIVNDTEVPTLIPPPIDIPGPICIGATMIDFSFRVLEMWVDDWF